MSSWLPAVPRSAAVLRLLVLAILLGGLSLRPLSVAADDGEDVESGPAAVEVVADAPAAEPADAASGQPIPGGKIVFQQSAGGDIYLVNADGSHPRVIGQGIEPALSPDGSRVIYARWTAPPGLYVYNIETGNTTRYFDVAGARWPSWSPTSGMIAFFEPESTDRVTVRLRLYDPGVPPKLERVTDDGWRISLLQGNQPATFAFPRTWEGRTGVSPKSVFSPAWSPDGREIVYKGEQGLYRAFVGSPPVQDLGRIPNTDFRFAAPQWSPDGSRILYLYRQHDHWEIGWISPDGATGLQLLTRPQPFERAPDNVAPTWSPDGKSIAFLSDREEAGVYKIYVMDADGSNPQKLLDIPVGYEGQFDRVLFWGP